MLTAAVIFFSIWISFFEPTHRQWRAARPLLDIGATVETEPRKESDWVALLMPSGWSENIVAVKFNRNQVTQRSLDALHELPYLKRLYMERAGVEDRHLVEIAKLKSLRRLSLWGNSITDEGASVLAELPRLDVVDLTENSKVTWRTWYSFRDRKKTKVFVPHSQCSYYLAGDEIDQLAALGAGVVNAFLEKVNDQQITRAISRFHMANSMVISCDESNVTRSGLLALRRSKRLEFVYLTFSNPNNESLVPLLQGVCEIWGPKTERVLFFRVGQSSDFQLEAADQTIVCTINGGLPSGDAFASLKGLRNARSIHFCGVDATTDSQATSLVRSLPMLRHLKFSEFCGLDQAGYSLVAKLDSLESLRLSGPTYGANANIPIAFFAKLACRDTLQHVEIWNCGITREHLWPLLEFPRLNSIKLYEQTFEADRCEATEWLPQLRKELASR